MAPTVKNAGQLAPDDISAAFSTLFAVKLPSRADNGSDERVISLHEAFPEVLNTLGYLNIQASKPAQPFVFLSGPGKQFVKYPLTFFDSVSTPP